MRARRMGTAKQRELVVISVFLDGPIDGIQKSGDACVQFHPAQLAMETSTRRSELARAFGERVGVAIISRKIMQRQSGMQEIPHKERSG